VKDLDVIFSASVRATGSHIDRDPALGGFIDDEATINHRPSEMSLIELGSRWMLVGRGICRLIAQQETCLLAYYNYAMSLDSQQNEASTSTFRNFRRIRYLALGIGSLMVVVGISMHANLSKEEATRSSKRAPFSDSRSPTISPLIVQAIDKIDYKSWFDSQSFDQRLWPAAEFAYSNASRSLQEMRNDMQCANCHSAHPIPTLQPLYPILKTMLNTETAPAEVSVPTMRELPYSEILIQQLDRGESLTLADEHVIAEELLQQGEDGGWHNPNTTYPLENSGPLPSSNMVRLLTRVRGEPLRTLDVDAVTVRRLRGLDYLEFQLSQSDNLTPYERLNMLLALVEADATKLTRLEAAIDDLEHLQSELGSFPATVIAPTQAEKAEIENDVLATVMIADTLQTIQTSLQDIPDADSLEQHIQANLEEIVSWLWSQQSENGLWEQAGSRYSILGDGIDHAYLVKVLNQYPQLMPE
jgi:hypothetical protein